MHVQKTAEELAAKLYKDGYFVVDGVSPNLKADLEKEFLKMPEFKKHFRFEDLSETDRYGCGGTSFLGNPSVFHNMTSQRFRTKSARYLMPILARFVPLLGDPRLKLARYLDRIQVRPRGEAPSAEAWHRDSPPAYAKGEFWTGGFQNCDDRPTKFSMIKGTHLFNESGGFKPISQFEHDDLNRKLLAQANQEDTDTDGNIIVPPNHIIIFISTVAHQVYGTKDDGTKVKHFLGFRVTPYNSSGVYRDSEKKLNAKGKPIPFKSVLEKKTQMTIQEVQQQMINNEAMTLPSGQIPPMYPALYLVNLNNLPKFERLQRDVLVENCMRLPLRDAEGKILHKSAIEGHRSMKSLAEMGFPLIPYPKVELDMVIPQKDVEIFNYDTGSSEKFSINYPGARYPTPNKKYDVPAPIHITSSKRQATVGLKQKLVDSIVKRVSKPPPKKKTKSAKKPSKKSKSRTSGTDVEESEESDEENPKPPKPVERVPDSILQKYASFARARQRELDAMEQQRHASAHGTNASDSENVFDDTITDHERANPFISRIVLGETDVESGDDAPLTREQDEFRHQRNLGALRARGKKERWLTGKMGKMSAKRWATLKGKRPATRKASPSLSSDEDEFEENMRRTMAASRLHAASGASSASSAYPQINHSSDED